MPAAPSSAPHPRARNVTVVLGPTNTGKTHLAVERMIAHETGMIGLPLRLLAREIYDRVVEKCGAHAVALITGEEKIVPSEPRYYVCTVEAMPADVEVDFLAIDEIQLASDLERGHIFTDRLMHRRGLTETMVLGAGTMRILVEQLLPGAHFVSRARFSRLAYAGQKKITRLPPRSAIVAFSAERVYAVAELIRRQRGGAAVVMGALSPRTRNAQVELFQSGEVDFVVATDAIGMGLNMDVDHVAFASTRKFDGFLHRGLSPAELAQIAGRAGRHMNDGTFGVTGEADPLEADVVEQLETHQFEPVKVLQWRNRRLDFSSIDALLTSLGKPPSMPGLTRTVRGDDSAALEFLSRDPEIAQAATGDQAVELLWEVCQIPDYRNITGSDHASLVGRVFGFLNAPGGVIPTDWFAKQVSYADRSDGDIDTLSNRIAHIRTWTYLANRAGWLEDAQGWQLRTKAIEDKLSDALHERLTQRFVDRRTSVLMKRLREKEKLMTAVSDEGEILVEGQHVGRLRGFHFVPDQAAEGEEGRTLKAASMKAVAAEIAAQAKRFTECADSELELATDGAILWKEARIARLAAADHILRPRVQINADDQLTGDERTNVQERLELWLTGHISAQLEPLIALDRAEGMEGLARGLAFRLVEALGVVPREEVADDVKSLNQDMRGSLRKHGVRFGALSIYLPVLLKPAATRLKVTLWGLQRAAANGGQSEDMPEPPQQGLTSTRRDPAMPEGFYRLVGYRECGERVVRIDMLERLADMIRPLVYWKPETPEAARPLGSVPGGGFTVTADMMSLVGCSGDEFAAILRALGFQMERRPAPPPEPEAAPKPDAAQGTLETAAAGTAAGAAEAAPDAGETVADAAQEASGEDAAAPQAPAPAEPEEPATPVADAADAAPAETAASGEPAADAEAEDTIEVWRPRKSGRQRPAQRGPRRDDRQRGKQARPHKGKDKGKPKGKDRGQGKDKPPQHRTARPPRTKPEDSPFAALSALKDAMQDTKRSGGK